MLSTEFARIRGGLSCLASPTPLCSCLSKFHKCDNYDKVTYIVPSYHQSYKVNLKAVLTCHQNELTPPLFPRIPTNHLCKCTFSKGLTYNQANLKELCNRGTLQDITNKNRHCMKSPTPATQCTRVFLKRNTLFVMLTLEIKYQRQAEHGKSFENS